MTFSLVANSANAKVITQILNSSSERIAVSTPSSDDAALLMSQITDLSKELDSAQSKVNQLSSTLNYKDEEIARLNAIIASLKITSPSVSTENIVNVSNKSPSNIQNIKQETPNLAIITQPQISGKCADTIVFQAKQLAKAYDEISNVKSSQNYLNKILDNFVFLAQNLNKQGKIQDAAAVYEVLSRAEIKNPVIYSELAQIYQKLGMQEEANKEYIKLNSLFPNLKGNENRLK